MPGEYDHEYEPPEFLQGQSADEIHARMLDAIPADIDKGEGGIAWDFTRPAALEKAEMAEYVLNETVKLIFPQWSYGKWLDMHGEKANVRRREANRASGELAVSGVPGTAIPEGFRFATAAGLSASVVFEASEEAVLDGEPDGETGMATKTVRVRAAEGGAQGNVGAGTVTLMVSPMRGIASITNPEPMTGGTGEEADSEYMPRILDAMRGGSSMTGCRADYSRWAKEVPGVGQVVVEPEWDDPEMPEEFGYADGSGQRRKAGAVRLLVTDSNGQPANEDILSAVRKHIAGENEEDMERRMPIGAHLTVDAPKPVSVAIRAEALLDEGEEPEAVEARVKDRLMAYWAEVAQEAAEGPGHSGQVRASRVGAVIAGTPGVVDYRGLTLNGGTENVAIGIAQYPAGEVELDEWQG